jgi:chromosome segregation ATPase
VNGAASWELESTTTDRFSVTTVAVKQRSSRRMSDKMAAVEQRDIYIKELREDLYQRKDEISCLKAEIDSMAAGIKGILEDRDKLREALGHANTEARLRHEDCLNANKHVILSHQEVLKLRERLEIYEDGIPSYSDILKLCERLEKSGAPRYFFDVLDWLRSIANKLEKKCLTTS